MTDKQIEEEIQSTKAMQCGKDVVIKVTTQQKKSRWKLFCC